MGWKLLVRVLKMKGKACLSSARKKRLETPEVDPLFLDSTPSLNDDRSYFEMKMSRRGCYLI